MKPPRKSATWFPFPLHSRAAGIYVGATLMQVCVPRELSDNHNRGFGTTTRDLRGIVAWLTECGVTYVAMEATGVYWVPLFNMLSRAGIEAVLLNAADVKNYTARKTDVNDAEWLMTLMRYGMVRPSFQIDDLSRCLRNYTRHRASQISVCSDVVRRMQKALELMNVKLTEVISDITGASGIRIIEAIIAGETDPRQLASMASRCARSTEEIALALEGTWDTELIFMLGQHYAQYKLHRQQLQELDPMIENVLTKLAERVIMENGGEVTTVIASGKKAKRPSNCLRFDFEHLATQIYGVNLMRIDGVSAITVLALLGELGQDFTEDFKDAAHFCSWCNLSPHDKISGGKILSSHRRKGTNQVGLTLRNCAQTLAGSKSVLGDYYRRMRAKGGGKFAVCATAHKIATIIYTMVKTKREYDPLKVSISDKAWLQRRIARQEKVLEKLKKLAS